MIVEHVDVMEMSFIQKSNSFINKKIKEHKYAFMFLGPKSFPEKSRDHCGSCEHKKKPYSRKHI
jgi:hypothetical protein